MQKNKRNTIIGVVLTVGVLTALILIFVISPSQKVKKNPYTVTQQEPVEPVFRKDGTLKFEINRKKTKTITIEIADNDEERTQGLMYRKSMPDSCGMLFIFDVMQPLSFWMKNTRIPLDIIYIDKDFSIVNIAENTEPFSEVSIPSGKDAMYVVEVNAGFCKKNNIVAGTKISYNLN
ncbi:MAG TPA: DUF192 domain-containing protein [Bacteroidales bacterium]|nr:DUF192 domain-containing protein [Bacteroidales bacterium]